MKTNSKLTLLELKSKYNIAVIISEYYPEIVDRLKFGVDEVLKNYPQIKVAYYYVSGSFELPIVCQKIIPKFDAAIALGVIVQGETRHFDFICNSVSEGLMRVMLKANKVIGFGVLTVNNLKQALDRSAIKGEKSKSNKGSETTISLIKALAAIETKAELS